MLIALLVILVIAALLGPLGRSAADERRSDLTANARQGQHFL
jgi:hypothetical protein